MKFTQNQQMVFAYSECLRQGYELRALFSFDPIQEHSLQHLKSRKIRKGIYNLVDLHNAMMSIEYELNTGELSPLFQEAHKLPFDA